MYAQGFIDGLDGGPFDGYAYQQSREYRQGYRDSMACRDYLVNTNRWER